MESRPTLDVARLDSSPTLRQKRRHTIQRVIRLAATKDERKQSREVVSKYRRKQKRRLSGSSDSDPDPYNETYVFYCLTT